MTRIWTSASIVFKQEDIEHEWEFDLPWHMFNWRDWFYMVDTGYISPVYFLHVRILGIRSTWKIGTKTFT